MRRLISQVLVGAAILVMAANISAQPGQAREVTQETITLFRGKERVLDVNASSISVANPSVADASPFNNNQQVLINAKAPGSTEVRIIPLDNPTITFVYNVIVNELDIQALKSEVEDFLAYMVGVQVDAAGDQLVLKGEVLESQDRQRLNKIIELYEDVVLDFTVDRFAMVEEERLKELILSDLEDEGLTTIQVDIKNVRGEFKALLRGVAFTDRAKERAQEITQLYYENVVNLIQLTKPIIEIDVVMATLDLGKIKQLGTNDVWTGATTFQITGYLDSNFGRSSFYDNNNDNNIGQGPAGARRPDEPGISVAPTFSIGLGPEGEGFSTFIRALKQTDAAVFYAEQHQAVLSGQKADFQDGGSVVVVPNGINAGPPVEIDFGFQVEVTPEQKEDGTIISTLKVENKVPVAQSRATEETTIAFSTLKTESIVECRSDETIVLSGLDSNNLISSENGTPFLRRVPLLNLLFRARDKQGAEARSLIFITPTSSTIFREDRSSFSTSSQRKADFMKNESIYWERDLDWGYYNEFYEKPGNQVPYINTYSTTLYYDDSTQSVSTRGEESYILDDPAMDDSSEAMSSSDADTLDDF